MFVDEATIEVKGGDGGNGIVAFRREKYMPMGGPSGGDGGSGGSVILRADGHKRTLYDLSRARHHKGDRGRHGEGSRRHGKDGQGITVPVPVGTQVFIKETGELIADLVAPGQEFVAAQGGAGGRGNVHFSNSSRQAPKFSELGALGEDRTLLLSLKLLADVALIGLPNAGKSTLIASISAAKPKIAAYPFTTLIPNLGVVKVDPARLFTAADIPGLIRGAHKGSGLGHQFLKHIERAPVFVHLVDPFQPKAYRNFLAINRELKMWKREMIERPQLVVITKMDTVDEETLPEVELLKAKFEARGCEVFLISAATQEGLAPLLERAMSFVEIEREKALLEPQQIPVVLTQSRIDKPLHIKEIARYADDQSEWDVTGGPMERLTGRFDMQNTEAVFYIHRILERSGTLEEMRNAGVKYGDLVHVGGLTFEFGE
ncbi:GTP-binding protein [Abditibacterium utsteinense]|uniref:GTPase Obg n=1 Tax=Abditibacterium utsteinense TaxID=1960156 RepID=A0A2S8SW71_9BACT|nr:GTPase ObgE [Abditibacterium utsteinense]PQV65043.1 GTP-binding protein [Abditibacterium utsteinense]